MATRSMIQIEGVNYAQIYKHYDGYPPVMLPWLEAFNRQFTEKRSNDIGYRFAQCLRFASKHAEKYELDDSEITGWGVVPFGADCGQEFTYLLKRDGSVLVNGKAPTAEDREV